MDLPAAWALPVPRLQPGGIVVVREGRVGVGEGMVKEQNLAVVDGKGGGGGAEAG